MPKTARTSRLPKSAFNLYFKNIAADTTEFQNAIEPLLTTEWSANAKQIIAKIQSFADKLPPDVYRDCTTATKKYLNGLDFVAPDRFETKWSILGGEIKYSGVMPALAFLNKALDSRATIIPKISTRWQSNPNLIHIATFLLSKVKYIIRNPKSMMVLLLYGKTIIASIETAAHSNKLSELLKTPEKLSDDRINKSSLSSISQYLVPRSMRELQHFGLFQKNMPFARNYRFRTKEKTSMRRGTVMNGMINAEGYSFKESDGKWHFNPSNDEAKWQVIDDTIAEGAVLIAELNNALANSNNYLCLSRRVLEYVDAVRSATLPLLSVFPRGHQVNIYNSEEVLSYFDCEFGKYKSLRRRVPDIQIPVSSYIVSTRVLGVMDRLDFFIYYHNRTVQIASQQSFKLHISLNQGDPSFDKVMNQLIILLTSYELNFKIVISKNTDLTTKDKIFNFSGSPQEAGKQLTVYFTKEQLNRIDMERLLGQIEKETIDSARNNASVPTDPNADDYRLFIAERSFPNYPHISYRNEYCPSDDEFLEQVKNISAARLKRYYTSRCSLLCVNFAKTYGVSQVGMGPIFDALLAIFDSAFDRAKEVYKKLEIKTIRVKNVEWPSITTKKIKDILSSPDLEETLNSVLNEFAGKSPHVIVKVKEFVALWKTKVLIPICMTPITAILECGGRNYLRADIATILNPQDKANPLRLQDDPFSRFVMIEQNTHTVTTTQLLLETGYFSRRDFQHETETATNSLIQNNVP